MRWILLTLLVGMTSCSFDSTKYRSHPENPYRGIQKVIVLPFVNMTRSPHLDLNTFSDSFASELIKFPGFDVIRPVLVQAVLEKGEVIRTIDDAVKVGRRMHADGILAVAITDHNSYDPPRTALQVQFLRTRAQRMSAGKIDEMIQSASWRVGPYQLSPGKAGYLVDAFQKMWDAHSKNVRDEIKLYSESMEDRDTAYRDENEFLAVQDRWMQFVSNQAINLLIERAIRYGFYQS